VASNALRARRHFGRVRTGCQGALADKLVFQPLPGTANPHQRDLSGYLRTAAGKAVRAAAVRSCTDLPQGVTQTVYPPLFG